jgi:TolB-like protein
MLRMRTIAAAATLAVTAIPAIAAAQDNRPVVVVFTFTNSSIAAGRADFDGISTGVQDLLITDMAANAKIRLVDRARIAELLQEQKMVKDQQIDPATAVRLGKIMGAQYAVTGGFMSDGKGKAVLTGRTIDMETSQIANPEKIEGSSSDVLGMIAQLSSKLAGGMNLAPKPGRRVGDAGPSGDAKPAAKPAAAPEQSGAPAASAVEQYARPVTQKPNVKLDAASLKLYSNALDEMDKGNKAKAKQLLEQVVAKNGDFEPAKAQLKKVS